MWSNKGRSRAVRSHFGGFPCGRPTKSSRLWLKGQRRASFCYNYYYCYCADDPLPAVGAPLFPFPLPGCRLLPGGTDTSPLPFSAGFAPALPAKPLPSRRGYGMIIGTSFIRPSLPRFISACFRLPAPRLPPKSGRGPVPRRTAAHGRRDRQILAAQAGRRSSSYPSIFPGPAA